LEPSERRSWVVWDRVSQGTDNRPAAPETLMLGGEFEVRRMGFGAMRLTGGGVWGDPPDPDGARALLRRGVVRGVNFIDTADSYGPEVSERLIAEALHPYPDDLVIATKGGLLRSGPSEWRRDCRPEHLREACEGSLRRLRVERIDLYQLHAVDPKVPLEDSVGALAELRDEGKVRLVGLSNVDPDELERAREIVPVVSVQNRYGPRDRYSDPMVEVCERDALAFIPWFPLGAGGAGEDATLRAIAAERGATPFQVALAWLLRRSPAMLPIPGTSSIEHLEENLAAAELRLDDEDLELLEA
jgi:pyridoxine 4-dehydrogenase